MIYQNSIICFLDVGLNKKRTFERVLWIAPDRSQVVLINIDDKRKYHFLISEIIKIYYLTWNAVMPK